MNEPIPAYIVLRASGSCASESRRPGMLFCNTGCTPNLYVQMGIAAGEPMNAHSTPCAWR
jgi:hypothetical protein